MSQEVDREKVLQTAKVRTSIKSDLSWIQKMKRAAEDGKQSTELTEQETSPLRQSSYVLMTAKKFESATSPPQTPKELICPTEPETSENGLHNGKHSEPVSPEPTAASTTTEEKNYAEPPKSNVSAEISPKIDVKESCQDATFEAPIVNDTTSEHESVANTVPDILAQTEFNSPPTQENGNEVSKANALDILSDSLVEPILNSESNEVSKVNALDILSDSLVEPILNSESNEVSKPNALDILSDSLVEPILNAKYKEAEVSPSSETEAAETVPNGDTNTLNDDKPAIGQTCDEIVEVADQPQDSIATTETVSSPTKEDIIVSKTTTAEVTVVQNDSEPGKAEASSDADVAKDPETFAISSDADVPQDNAETKETELTSTKEVSEAASAEINLVQNNVDPLKTSEEAFEVPKEPELPASVDEVPKDNAEPKEPEVPASVSEVPQDNAEPKETQSTTEYLVEDGSINGNINIQNDVEPVKVCQAAVEEPKEPEVSATITDVPQDNVDPTATETTSTIVESGITNAEVAEQKASDITAISSDVPLTDSEVQSQGLPSTNGDTIVDDTIAKDNIADQGITEEVVSESKEEIVEQKPEDANSVVDSESAAQIDEEVKVLEEKSDATGAKESPENPDQVETSVIPEKETVINAKTAEESTVSETFEQKAQTETTDDSMVPTETIVVTPTENVENLNTVEVQTSIETPEVQESVQSSNECKATALAETNHDDIFKAEPVVVEPSPESSALEDEESSPLKNMSTVEETSPVVPSVAGENQADFDISDALDRVPNNEQSKEEAGTDAVDKTVKASEESGEEQPTDNSAPSPVEKEETISQLIIRDGKAVCSHCDQFIGLIKLTFSYPPMYLHPECLTCGGCSKVLGDLLFPIFEHNHQIHCSDCYNKVYSLT